MEKHAKKLTIIFVALAVVGLCVAVGFNRTEKPVSQEQAVKTETEQTPSFKEKREAQAQKLARLAKERGGLPIDQALDQAASDRHRDFIKKDMAYQKQTPDESRMIALDRLSEVEGKLAKASDPRQIAMLEKQVEMLRQIAERFE